MCYQFSLNDKVYRRILRILEKCSCLQVAGAGRALHVLALSKGGRQTMTRDDFTTPSTLTIVNTLT